MLQSLVLRGCTHAFERSTVRTPSLDTMDSPPLTMDIDVKHMDAIHLETSHVDSLSHGFIDANKEKKLIRKLDLWISPIMTIIFLTAYLDRSNIGNAASAGMVADLNMTSAELGSMPRSLFELLLCSDIDYSPKMP